MNISEVVTVIKTLRTVIADNSLSIQMNQNGFDFVVVKNFSHSDAEYLVDELDTALMIDDVCCAVEASQVSKTRSRISGHVQF